MVHVYILFGAGGAVYSGGLESKLATMLRALPGNVHVPKVLNYGAWPIFVSAIKSIPLDHPVVLIGHSIGAAMTTHIAHKVYPRRIHLVVGYDCTMWSRQMPMPDNVDQVIEFKGHSWVNPFGLRLLRKGAEDRYQTYSRSEAHIAFDDDLSLHGIVCQKVAALGE